MRKSIAKLLLIPLVSIALFLAETLSGILLQDVWEQKMSDGNTLESLISFTLHCIAFFAGTIIPMAGMIWLAVFSACKVERKFALISQVKNRMARKAKYEMERLELLEIFPQRQPPDWCSMCGGKSFESPTFTRVCKIAAKWLNFDEVKDDLDLEPVEYESPYEFNRGIKADWPCKECGRVESITYPASEMWEAQKIICC